MDKLKPKIENILRWISFVPAAFVAYFFAKLLSNICISWGINPDLVYDLSVSLGFGGHYILGPLFVFQREMVAVLAFLHSGFYVSGQKKFSFFILLSVVVIYLASIFMNAGTYLADTNIPREYFVRVFIELAGQIVAVIFASVAVTEKYKSKEHVSI